MRIPLNRNGMIYLLEKQKTKESLKTPGSIAKFKHL